MWSGEQLIAIGEKGMLLTSSDGINWQRQYSPTSHDLYSMAYSGNLFVAVGDSGTVIASSDTVNWQIRNQVEEGYIDYESIV